METDDLDDDGLSDEFESQIEFVYAKHQAEKEKRRTYRAQRPVSSKYYGREKGAVADVTFADEDEYRGIVRRRPRGKERRDPSASPERYAFKRAPFAQERGMQKRRHRSSHKHLSASYSPGRRSTNRRRAARRYKQELRPVHQSADRAGGFYSPPSGGKHRHKPRPHPSRRGQSHAGKKALPVPHLGRDVSNLANGAATSELGIMKCILLRESYLSRLRRTMRAKIAGKINNENQPSHNKDKGSVAENGLEKQFGALLDLLRIVSLEVVEAIVQHVQATRINDGSDDESPIAYSYEWKGENYLLKMVDDSDFLAEVPQLHKWLGYELYRNPFLCTDGLPPPQRDMPTSSTAIALARAEAAEAAAAGNIMGMENYKAQDEPWAKRIWRASTILLHVEAEAKRAPVIVSSSGGGSVEGAEVDTVAGNIIGSAKKRKPGHASSGGGGTHAHGHGEQAQTQAAVGKQHEDYLNAMVLSQMNGSQSAKLVQGEKREGEGGGEGLEGGEAHIHTHAHAHAHAHSHSHSHAHEREYRSDSRQQPDDHRSSRRRRKVKRRPLSAESLLHSGHHHGHGHHQHSHHSEQHRRERRSSNSGRREHHHEERPVSGSKGHKSGGKYGKQPRPLSSGGHSLKSGDKGMGMHSHKWEQDNHKRPKSANIAISALRPLHPLAYSNSNNQHSTSKLRRRIQRARLETQKLEEQLELEQQLALDMRASEYDDEDERRRALAASDRGSSSSSSSAPSLAHRPDRRRSDDSAVMISADSLAALSKISNLCDDAIDAARNLSFEGLKAATSGIHSLGHVGHYQPKSLIDEEVELDLEEDAHTVGVESGVGGLKLGDDVLGKGDNEHGDNSLHNAVRAGMCTAEHVELFIAAGGDVNSRNNAGQTALHLAALNTGEDGSVHGVAAVVDVLMRNGAELEALDDGGCTPLLSAATVGHEAAIRALLGHGADANPTPGSSPRARGALMLALDADDTNGTSSGRALLEGGADPNSVDSDGNTALHYCAIKGQVELAKLLLRKQWSPNAKVNKKNSAGQTPLLYALFSGYEGHLHTAELPILQLLLVHGADPDIADKQMHTPLHIAADDRTQMVGSEPQEETTLQLLCRSVQTLEPKDSEGNTPLHWASTKGNASAVATLLHMGANPNCRNKHMKQPAQLAHESGDVTLVQQLVRASEEYQAGTGADAIPATAATVAVEDEDEEEEQDMEREVEQALAHEDNGVGVSAIAADTTAASVPAQPSPKSQRRNSQSQLRGNVQDLISSDSSSRSHAEHPAGPPGGAHPPVPVHKASVPDDSSDAIDDDEDSDNYLVIDDDDSSFGETPRPHRTKKKTWGGKALRIFGRK